ncbi:MAG TPA: tRNA (adenosine(37)-N6)-threonylcarbamoyltransferase complex dimerization subunit type 1 TsaB [Gemmatimonadales bacterium]|nr:tRNA (adenosine(37)-N6)-threonylcarbamoyltransferase complex dimerization subunit type 1 TsaB [Gemmatimonadales bacterium]
MSSRERYLALDTATDVPTLALGSPDAPGEDLRIASRRDLSRDVERVAAELLARRGARVRDLAGVIVADGPGSFTGLRIGIAFAKGLCRAAGLALASAPSLLGAALAASGGRGTVLVEYDAQRGDRYRAVYRFADAPPDRRGVTGSARVEVLAAPTLVPGDAPPPSLPDLVRAGAAHASAACLIRLGAVAGGLAGIAAPDAWEPAYGRLAEAEARYRARHG